MTGFLEILPENSNGEIPPSVYEEFVYRCDQLARGGKGLVRNTRMFSLSISRIRASLQEPLLVWVINECTGPSPPTLPKPQS